MGSEMCIRDSCSIPIIIRSLEGKLPKKHSGSCIVALSPDGKYTIPLLDTHSGANELATKLATILNSKPVITTQSDTFLGVSPEKLLKKYHFVS